MGQLTTHVLDTSAGLPAAGVRLRLLPLDSASPQAVVRITGSDGRCAPLLAGDELRAGRYELTFDTAAYFIGRKISGFYPFVEIAFAVRQGEQHLHIPLLLSPHGYTTYRGS